MAKTSLIGRNPCGFDTFVRITRILTYKTAYRRVAHSLLWDSSGAQGSGPTVESHGMTVTLSGVEGCDKLAWVPHSLLWD